MEIENPNLGFPQSFCCNCGDTNCTNVTQDTRVWRFFGIGNRETTFKLSVPVCAACRRTIRRRPAGFFSRMSVLLLTTGVIFGTCIAFWSSAALPLWIGYISGASVLLGVILTYVFYRLRRPKPPQTSFYQPVRIKAANLQFSGLMAGDGQVGYMKLAFTNPDYLNVFVDANQAAIKAKRVAVVRA